MKPFPSVSAPQNKTSSLGCSPKQSLRHGCAGPHAAGQPHHVPMSPM